jgi:hypothetical protein
MAKMLAWAKLNNLLGFFIRDEEKKFYNIGTRVAEWFQTRVAGIDSISNNFWSLKLTSVLDILSMLRWVVWQSSNFLLLQNKTTISLYDKRNIHT